MTAEQLEELLAACDLVDHKNYSPEFEKLHRIAPSLARRVLAAEKLVEAIKGLDYTTNHIEAALTSYREASK